MPWLTAASRAARVMGVHSDRKSTRLNSSHLVISYAVFCLKKKKPHLHPRRHGLPLLQANLALQHRPRPSPPPLRTRLYGLRLLSGPHPPASRLSPSPAARG